MAAIAADDDTTTAADSRARPATGDSDDIQRRGALFAKVGQMAVHQVQANEADRNVDEEDHAPVKVLDDQSARQWTRRGSDQAGDGAASGWVPGDIGSVKASLPPG